MVPLNSWGHQFFFSIVLLHFPVPMYLLSSSFFLQYSQSGNKMVPLHRRFTGNIHVTVCFITRITFGAAGLVFNIISFQKVRYWIDFSLAGYFPVSFFVKCEVLKQQ